MRVLGVIPARLGSTRIPNKPLQLLAGEPLVTRVIERVRELGLVDSLVVATDSTMVCRVVELAGARALLTKATHASGTERVAEVAALPEFAGCDVVANIQGDEPFLPGPALAGALRRVEQGDEVGTAAAPLAPDQAGDPDRVKVIADARGRALYFSRAAIPYRRDRNVSGQGLYWQHLGVYAYRRDALERWTRLAPVPAEEAERLEQLRALYHGMRVGVAQLGEPAEPGVDTPEDLRRAEAHWLEQEEHR
ncbi:MAG TPA: 3-deoxy-manno-octulosonate cytidylyltransferase [Gemmatimonadales bacterium]|jgi:3-deoxy-manno-octulosonate cytidylyltransferase (CMP-KDO synthetase)|nr:3-deoxy-manno-octulosonate cytidylyltransferase [Gemmatimonadales bacterium]